MMSSGVGIPKGLIAAAVVTLGLAFSGTAGAVPCGNLLSFGGVAPSVACQNGPAGDTADSAADLNQNSGFFGSTSWTLLDNTADGVDSAYWNFTPGSPNGTKFGLFSLDSSIWNGFSKLAVVLNGSAVSVTPDFARFNTQTPDTNPVNWSAYLLPSGYTKLYGWTYDFTHVLSNASLYGVVGDGGPTTVPEPAAFAMVLFGLGAGVWILRRRAII